MTSTAIALLDRLGARRMPHGGGRSLREHLVGTSALAEAWGYPRYLQCAALFHSVYGTAVYRRAVAGAERREEIRAAIGADAERLAFAFGALDRARFGAALAEMTEPAGVTLATRLGEPEVYTPREVVDLVLLAFANEIEQGPPGSPTRVRILCGPLVDVLERWDRAHVPAGLRAFLESAREDETRGSARM